MFKLDGTLPLPEIEMNHWQGFALSGPVRVGNQAAEHVQNDVYGEILLILAPLYFDDRLSYLREDNYTMIFERLALRAYETLWEKDAGLWEHRNSWKRHCFTFLMSWAGLDRYLKLLTLGKIKGNIQKVQEWYEASLKELYESTYEGVIFNSPEEHTPDAALFFLAILRFPSDNIVRKTTFTLHEILGVKEEGAKESTFIYRYQRGDDFGKPKHAFVICTYWLIEALAKLGEVDRARKILIDSLRAANHVGLLSEHFDVKNNQQTGNFPQCYSHVGLINAAFAVSLEWDKLL